MHSLDKLLRVGEEKFGPEIKDNVSCVVRKKTYISIKPEAYRHDLPFSKGGTSLTAANVRILCMKHNLKKHDKILSFPPIFLS